MSNYTKRQWITLVVFSLAQFCNAVCVSLQAPFYPAEAEKKGATPSQYGLVFGIFELTVFLVSPIYGRYMSKWGPKFINNAGIFTVSVMCILFGFLDRMNDTATFIGFSFAVRIVEALGNAAFVTSAFSIIANEFPKNVGSAFATMETFFGVGLIVGPTVGGALYELGGYTLPFVSLGVVLLLAAILTSCLLPSNGAEASPDSQITSRQFLSALRLPSIILSCFALLSASISIGFMQATLEPHLRPLKLTPLKVGLMFVLSGSMYALTAPFWGWLCDKWVKPRFITTLGALLVVVAFIFVGPMPFLPLETTIRLCIGALIIHGIGFGAVLVSTFTGAHRDVISNGFPDDLSTYGLVSGIWTSTFALGCFIGPSVGGVLLDYFGFKWASVFVAALHVLVVLSLGVYICCKGSDRDMTYTNIHECLSQAKDERHTLLTHPNGDCDSTYGSAGSSQENLPSIP
ncbi:MFS-type transporter SLC18B1-like [Homarus americanus]|uniref:MFS-type transporter Slc18B1-like 1 n=1 Tax=Homarus americanus TaxID=6706 RepID=A0A8J5MT95_HOMAM|nr:MFS-type transporter SLC18B1-like [Homarus americanus]KAG7163415.1 MFS-type transporter Slc18B1-like 1 [Homarus americanus]